MFKYTSKRILPALAIFTLSVEGADINGRDSGHSVVSRLLSHEVVTGDDSIFGALIPRTDHVKKAEQVLRVQTLGKILQVLRDPKLVDRDAFVYLAQSQLYSLRMHTLSSAAHSHTE